MSKKRKHFARDILKCDVCQRLVDTPIPCSTCTYKSCLECLQKFHASSKVKFEWQEEKKEGLLREFALVGHYTCPQCKSQMPTAEDIEKNAGIRSFALHFFSEVDAQVTLKKNYRERLVDSLHIIQADVALKIQEKFKSTDLLSCPKCPGEVTLAGCKMQHHLRHHLQEEKMVLLFANAIKKGCGFRISCSHQ